MYFIKYTAYILLIAALDFSGIIPYSSDVFGVMIAMMSGWLVMLRRAEDSQLTVGQAFGEIGLAGLAGFIAHAWAINQLENPRMIWVACACAGIGGSKFVEKYIKSTQGHKEIEKK